MTSYRDLIIDRQASALKFDSYPHILGAAERHSSVDYCAVFIGILARSTQTTRRRVALTIDYCRLRYLASTTYDARVVWHRTVSSPILDLIEHICKPT